MATVQLSNLEKVYAEIDMLPKQAQQVFKLIFVERKSTAEIAQLMNLSRNTVQNHRIRAMKLLRIALLKKKLFPIVVGYATISRISPYLAGLAGLLGFS